MRNPKDVLPFQMRFHCHAVFETSDQICEEENDGRHSYAGEGSDDRANELLQVLNTCICMYVCMYVCMYFQTPQFDEAVESEKLGYGHSPANSDMPAA